MNDRNDLNNSKAHFETYLIIVFAETSSFETQKTQNNKSKLHKLNWFLSKLFAYLN
jgi:hypothetical protein